jgi:PPOX class probable F420-dependent enzyme
MTALPEELRDLIESGPLTYISTTDADGSPHVTAIWIGLDDDTLISTHMRFNAKLRNMQRDPRVVLAFAPPPQPGDWMSPHAVIHATATMGPLGPTGSLLTRLPKVYIGPDAEYPDDTQTGSSAQRRPRTSCRADATARAWLNAGVHRVSSHHRRRRSTWSRPRGCGRCPKSSPA